MTEQQKSDPKDPSEKKLSPEDLEKAQGGYTATKERPAQGGGKQPASS